LARTGDLAPAVKEPTMRRPVVAAVLALCVPLTGCGAGGQVRWDEAITNARTYSQDDRDGPACIKSATGVEEWY
jgi:hypothetical protein